jgi:hypothetical protein
MTGDVEMQDLPSPMLETKKQYSSLNVTVGTVNKSKATIISR